MDTNKPLNPLEDDVYTVAFTLLDFLHCLLSPILPIKILNGIVKIYESQGSLRSDVVQGLVKELPKENAQIFVYLVSFFRQMLAYSEKNKLTPEKVSEIICECLVGAMDDKAIRSQFLNGDMLPQHPRSDTMIFHQRLQKSSAISRSIKEKRRDNQSIVKQIKNVGGTSHQSMAYNSANPSAMRYTNKSSSGGVNPMSEEGALNQMG